MSENTDIMFPTIALRFLSEVGTPPDLQDPDGDPMGIGDVVSLLMADFQELCMGMGVGMDVQFGLVDGADWCEFSDSIHEDENAFQHPDNHTAVRQGIAMAKSEGKAEGVVTEGGVFIPNDEEEVEALVEKFMDEVGNDLVEELIQGRAIEPLDPSEGSEDSEAVRGPQIGSIGQDTGKSDNPEGGEEE